MKLRCLYIIMSLASLLFLTNCRDEEVVRSSEGKRTITVDLGITMSRATDVEGVIGDYSRPDNLQLWIFDDNIAGATRIFYENITEGLQFSMVDLSNRLVQTIERIINVENEINNLHFYIVMNSEGISLGETSTPQDIEEATFTRQTTWTGDNKVPLYGYGTLDVSKHRSEYSVSIAATRAVGKLELFFTKENENSSLAITKVEITQGMPDKGYLAAVPTDDNRTYTAPNPSVVLFESEDGTITQFLPEEEGAFGEFSSHEDRFRSLLVSYLLENPNGEKWNGENQDWTYPETPQGTLACYKVVVSYQLNGNNEVGEMYLSEIKRNVWNKIFVRVKDKGELQIRYKAMPWEVVDSSIGYAPKPMTENPFSDKDDYAEFINNGESRYILLPLEKYRVERNDDGSIKYDYSNTQKLFNHLYENPEVGDNEARLCIITRPTYNDKIDKNQHWALKTGSAGARYYFMLTGPEGATWTAHLTNYDDFGFSNSETDDFAANTDDYGNDDVRMVTHGIARDKPYIIQIIAKNLYTGYQPAMSGETTEKGFNEDGYDQFKTKTKDEWKTYFGDDYLTGWGQAKWNAEEVVDTYFYITVKLKDGQDYVLKINPSYEDTEYDINAGANDFPFQKKHRYAGTDTHIWIRQIRAQHGIEFLEELAENESGIWWKDNQYWNPNHTWGNK